MKKRLGIARDHLVHVMPDLKMSGMTALALELGSSLEREYQHTLLYETPIDQVSPELNMQVGGSGITPLQADRITPELLDEGGYTGAIMYNVVGHPGLGEVIPTLYYSYGTLDPAVGPDVYVASSEYARTHRSYGPLNDIAIDEDYVIPPMLSYRSLRRIKSLKRPNILTVGILTSGYGDKYPCSTVIKLMGSLPKDVGVILNILPKYRNPGTDLAIQSRVAETKGKTWLAEIIPTAGIQYLLKCDVLLYATAEGHNEPGGRMVLEAMAMGKTVIVENKGVFADILKHGVNALLYDTVDEAVGHVKRLNREKDILLKIGANAQMQASWFDTSVHLSKLKRILRMIGT